MNSGSTLYRYLLGAPAQQCAGGYPTTQLLPQVIAASYCRKLQPCARHADLSGAEHTAPAEQERIACHAGAIPVETAVDSIYL